MTSLEAFIGAEVKSVTPRFFKRLPEVGGEAFLYHALVMPESWDEADAFREHGANEYDLIVRTGLDGKIQEFAFRIDQCPHGGRNFAPRGAPAWIFGQDARFSLDWDDVAPLAQDKMLELLAALTGITLQ